MEKQLLSNQQCDFADASQCYTMLYYNRHQKIEKTTIIGKESQWNNNFLQSLAKKEGSGNWKK